MGDGKVKKVDEKILKEELRKIGSKRVKYMRGGRGMHKGTNKDKIRHLKIPVNFGVFLAEVIKFSERSAFYGFLTEVYCTVVPFKHSMSFVPERKK